MITAVVVCHNTPDLIRKAVLSMMKYQPEVKILIVDGSDPKNHCQRVVQMLSEKFWNVKAFTLGYNIGHGAGLNYGISKATTKNVLIFDSDIVVRKPFLYDMLSFTDFYGVGKVVKVNDHGENSEEGIRYLHPYFAMISRKGYFQRKPFMNSGAPCLQAMKDLQSIGRPYSESVLIDFPVEDYVLHHERGTRKVIKRGRPYSVQT